MTLHDRYGLSRVINAAGSFTPVGVSRSSPAVAEATGEALRHFFVIDELQDALSRAVVRFTGAEAGTAVHCASAAITLAIAACMTGIDAARIAALPDTRGMPTRVILPGPHAVDYGHPIEQDIRLAGAQPVIVGTAQDCAIDDLATAMDQPSTACLLLVSSRLVRGRPMDLARAVDEAHKRGIAAVVDAAAQDMRIGELLATGADLVLVSAQKYLSSPTAGLVIGRRHLVEAVRAQGKGIGRAMKPSKEAIIGVLAAIEERERQDLSAWRKSQEEKIAAFAARAGGLRGVTVRVEADPAGMPLSRACLSVDSQRAGLDAGALAKALKAGSPPIWVMEHRVPQGELVFELVQVSEGELEVIYRRLAELIG